MTKELYYDSAYISEFFAQVTSCEKIDTKIGGKKTSGYAVILDRTAFFPEQGGQGSDTGVLEFDGLDQVDTSDGNLSGKALVLHVDIRSAKSSNDNDIHDSDLMDECSISSGNCEGTIITHIVDKEIPVGSRVHGVIDWDHRFSNMQQHTGEHIFSGLVNKKFGYNNVGFHLSDSEVTMDYDGPISLEEIKELERMANEAIWANLEVLCEFPDTDKLASIPYRSKKELEGDVRIVTIPGIDICACCAPHVDRTGEIGLLKVVNLQNHKGGVRVNILCGKRALEYINAEHEIVSELSGMLTTSSDKIISSVKRAFEDNTELKARLTKASEELINYEIEKLLGADSNESFKDNSKEGSNAGNNSSEVFESTDKSDIFLIKDDSFDSNMMRKFVNALAEKKEGYCGIFAGNSSEGYRFIITAGSAGKDCREICNKLRTEFGAKGGGQPAMVQGSIGPVDITEVVRKLTN